MSDFSPTIEDLLYVKEHDLLNDTVGQAVKKSISYGVASEFEFSVLKERVKRHKLSEAFSPSPPFKLPKLIVGNFLQGASLSGNEIRYPHLVRQEPSIVIGSTGSGKTNLFRFEALQWGVLTKGLWLFDLRKNDFAAMHTPFKKLGVDLQVVPARKLKINICQIPEGVDAPAFASALPHVAQNRSFQQVLLSLSSWSSGFQRTRRSHLELR